MENTTNDSLQQPNDNNVTIQPVALLDDDLTAADLFGKPTPPKAIPVVSNSDAHQTMSVQNADNTAKWSHEINVTEKVVEQKVFVKEKQSAHQLQALNKEHDLIVIQTVDINDDETFRGIGGIERVVMGKAENVVIKPLKPTENNPSPSITPKVLEVAQQESQTIDYKNESESVKTTPIIQELEVQSQNLDNNFNTINANTLNNALVLESLENKPTISSTPNIINTANILQQELVAQKPIAVTQPIVPVITKDEIRKQELEQIQKNITLNTIAVPKVIETSIQIQEPVIKQVEAVITPTINTTNPIFNIQQNITPQMSQIDQQNTQQTPTQQEVPYQSQPDFSLFETVENTKENTIKETMLEEKKQLGIFSDALLAKAGEPKNLKTILGALIVCGIGFLVAGFLAMNYADQSAENAKLANERNGQGSINKSRIVDLQLQLTNKNNDFDKLFKEHNQLKSEYETLNAKYIKIAGEAGQAPINVSYKDSKKGGVIMVVKNRDDNPLDVQFYLENITADEKIIVNKAIAPDNSVTIGLDDGWIFHKGDKITIKVAGFPDVVKKYGE